METTSHSTQMNLMKKNITKLNIFFFFEKIMILKKIFDFYEKKYGFDEKKNHCFLKDGKYDLMRKIHLILTR